jgi:hypothetical protein
MKRLIMKQLILAIAVGILLLFYLSARMLATADEKWLQDWKQDIERERITQETQAEKWRREDQATRAWQADWNRSEAERRHKELREQLESNQPPKPIKSPSLSRSHPRSSRRSNTITSMKAT